MTKKLFVSIIILILLVKQLPGTKQRSQTVRQLMYLSLNLDDVLPSSAVGKIV